LGTVLAILILHHQSLCGSFCKYTGKFLCEESLAFLMAVLELYGIEMSDTPPLPTVLMTMTKSIVDDYVR